MLSSSPAKIHEPRVTGVSPRPTDQRGARKLRNTSGSWCRASGRWLRGADRRPMRVVGQGHLEHRAPGPVTKLRR